MAWPGKRYSHTDVEHLFSWEFRTLFKKLISELHVEARVGSGRVCIDQNQKSIMIVILLAYPLRMIDLTAIWPHHGREGIRKGRQKVEFTVGVLGSLSVGLGVLCMKSEGKPGGSVILRDLRNNLWLSNEAWTLRHPTTLVLAATLGSQLMYTSACPSVAPESTVQACLSNIWQRNWQPQVEIYHAW